MPDFRDKQRRILAQSLAGAESLEPTYSDPVANKVIILSLPPNGICKL